MDLLILVLVLICHIMPVSNDSLVPYLLFAEPVPLLLLCFLRLWRSSISFLPTGLATAASYGNVGICLIRCLCRFRISFFLGIAGAQSSLLISEEVVADAAHSDF